MVAALEIIPPYYKEASLFCKISRPSLNFMADGEAIECQELTIDAEDVVIREFEITDTNSLILKDEPCLDVKSETNSDDDVVDDVKMEELMEGGDWRPLKTQDFDPYYFKPAVEDAILNKTTSSDKKKHKIRGQHKQSYRIKKVRIHKCFDCCLIFSDENALSSHVQLVHNHFQHFQCSECELIFDKKSKLSKHILNHSTKSSSNNFKCSECDLSFRRKGILKLHTFSAHFNEKEKCTDGNHSFCQILILNRCVNNDPSFSSESNLLKCSECNLAFIRERCLGHHIRSVHERFRHLRNTNVENLSERPKNKFENKLKLFRCLHCTYIYKDRVSLFTHILDDHNSISPQP